MALHRVCVFQVLNKRLDVLAELLDILRTEKSEQHSTRLGLSCFVATGRETETRTGRETQTQTGTRTDTHRHTGTQTQTHTQTHTHRHRHRHTEHTQTHRHTHRHTQTHAHTHKNTQTPLTCTQQRIATPTEWIVIILIVVEVFLGVIDIVYNALSGGTVDVL